jgi:amino acid transporter
MADTATIAQWASLRLAVGSSLFITWFLFLLAYWFSCFKQADKPIVYVKMTDLSQKMYLFGIGALLSLNFYQACIFTTIFTYFTMVTILILIAANYMGTAEGVRSKLYLVFYFILFVWYTAIMSDLYITYKSN